MASIVKGLRQRVLLVRERPIILSKDEVERIKRDAADLGRYSIHIAIVLSLMFSLTAVAILSKKHLTNYLWAEVPAFVVPMPVALYFRNRIVLLGVFTYIAALAVALIAAVLFGV
jgi:hypothetical protein